MRRRRLTPLLRARLGAFPAVALLGARQTGKTTLARCLGGRYFDLELEEDRVRLDLAWDRETAARGLLILDEAQSWPAIFPRLRAAIDADRSRKGRFLLLGSVSPALMRNVAESLAGRLALCELSPFLASELPHARLDRLWLRGGYPDGGILGEGVFPTWQRDYLTTIARRDLPNWGLTARPAVTERLFHMLAVSHGQIWNASEIGRSLGLSYHTVDAYLEHLIGSYLVRLVQPFHGNLRKRLVKRPRLYWRDSGLVHALLGVRGMDDLLVQPWVGASWEGFVVEQVLSHLVSKGREHGAWFLRTATGEEVGLVLDLGRRRWAIEVKLASRAAENDLVRLARAAELASADVQCLVTRTRQPVEGGNRLVTNLPGLLRALDAESG